MHFHPTTNGQPSPSPPGVFSSQTPHPSAPHNSAPSSTDPVHSSSTHTAARICADASQARKEDHFPPNWVEQLQLALAIANPELLQQLVLHCQSPLVAPHQLGHISAAVSIPVDGNRAADSVLSVEVLACQLSSTSLSQTRKSTFQPPTADSTGPSAAPESAELAHHRALVNQIGRETKLQTLGMNVPLPEAIALLQYATFSLPDIQRILNLPYNGWHRSWWSMVDPSIDQTQVIGSANAGFTIPFKRLIRSRRYADGTVMLQYKDQFAHIPPPCFRTIQKSVLVHIQRPGQSLADILSWMNHARNTLQTDAGLLLFHELSPVEQQALMNQGIYLYHCSSPYPNPSPPTAPPSLAEPSDPPGAPTATHSPNLAETPHLADCTVCIQHHCPMHGHVDSPVTTCRLFSV